MWVRDPQVRSQLRYTTVNIIEVSKRDNPSYFVDVVKDERRTKNNNLEFLIGNHSTVLCARENDGCWGQPFQDGCGNADYSMYSTFLTVSPGSVLFSRSNLLKRKDLCFSCLRLGLVRHRRSLRSSHLSSQVCHDSHRVTLDKPFQDGCGNR